MSCATFRDSFWKDPRLSCYPSPPGTAGDHALLRSLFDSTAIGVLARSGRNTRSHAERHHSPDDQFIALEEIARQIRVSLGIAAERTRPCKLRKNLNWGRL